MGEKGKVIGIDHIQSLVDFSISNIRKDKPWLLESDRVQLLGIKKIPYVTYSYWVSFSILSRRWQIGLSRRSPI